MICPPPLLANQIWHLILYLGEGETKIFIKFFYQFSFEKRITKKLLTKFLTEFFFFTKLFFFIGNAWIMLIFYRFEPDDAYQKYAYKKKRVMQTVDKATY